MENTTLGAIVAVALLVGSAVGAGVATVGVTESGPTPDDGGTVAAAGQPGESPGNATGVTTFDGESEFRTYLRNSQSTQGTTGRMLGADVRPTSREGDAVPMEEPVEAPMGEANADGGSSDRHSSTNVQETGIDEPDRLKNTGDHLYYASQQRYRVGPVEPSPSPDGVTGQTHVIDADEPANPDVIAGIEESGNLLLADNSLVVLRNDRLVGYDVTDPADPEQTWTRSINGSIETARMDDGMIYLVTRSPVSPSMDCPVEPLSGPGGAIECSDIYRPNRQIPADVTYTAFRLDPASGAIADSVSAVGTRERSAVYMSDNALYLTYTERTSRGELLIDAALSNETAVPDWVEARLREIQSYNLSERATEVEAEATIQQWIDNLPDDRRRIVSEQFADNLTAYVEHNRRDLVTTGIVRIGVEDDLAVEATGAVPGEPLNQFSMDEHEGTLRIATTIPRQFGTDSVNDLYTLDASSLERSGAVRGMGVDERVYAVRYVGETGYVVTFRQVDPFHVLNLSDPTDPEEVGELKLPGYSSYLHPIDDNHVLGIGEENRKVKTVLFDVSEPGDPTIEDTYYPNSHWSAVSQSHHAFLLDRRHEVFFLPGDDSGHVIGYTDGDLTPKDHVGTNGRPNRAAYIDDYLYVFSDRELVVVNETNWSRETAVTLSGH